MNKVEKVSIGGYAFTLEEQAFAKASSYLDELNAFYGKKTGGSEIMEGIEERMAELLLERVGAAGIGTEQDIDAIIAVLGRPETIEASSEEDNAAAPEEKPAKKKLYRDLSNRILGGVCSGLATYFDMDVVLFRLGFALLTFLTCVKGLDHEIVFTVPLLYIILWIAMPAAKTVRQKLELKGETGTVDEISRKIGDGAKEMVNEARTSPLLKNIMRFLGIAIGAVLLIGGTSGLSVGALLAFNHPLEVANISAIVQHLLDEISYPYSNLFYDPVVITLLVMAVILPFIWLLYEGLKLIFNFKAPKWHPGLVIFVIWLIVLVVFGILFFTGGYSADLMHKLDEAINV